MNEHNHKLIDVLKMDIEGASFEILNDLLDKKIYPKQIIVELERPFLYLMQLFLIYSHI